MNGLTKHKNAIIKNIAVLKESPPKPISSTIIPLYQSSWAETKSSTTDKIVMENPLTNFCFDGGKSTSTNIAKVATSNVTNIGRNKVKVPNVSNDS